jgi:hypothetical protein
VASGLEACDLCSMSSATEVSAEPTLPVSPLASAVLGSVAAGAAPVRAEPTPPTVATEPSPLSRLTIGLLLDARHASTLAVDGRTVGDPADQRLDTAVAQLMVAWRFTPTWSARVYLPFIHRRWEVSGVSGWYQGNGDAVVEGMATRQARRDARHFAVGNLFAGLKLPTGNSDRLADEQHDAASADAGGGHSHGGDAVSADGLHDALHPHDLALGSGSWDPIVGASGFLRWGRFYLTGHGQYVLRTEGDHGYRYGSGGMFGGGPGAFLIDRAAGTLGLHLNVSGELNERDHHRGVLVEDSGMREITAGPDLTFSWRNRVTGEIGVELPVWRDSPGTHLATNLRGHAGVSVRF